LRWRVPSSEGRISGNPQLYLNLGSGSKDSPSGPGFYWTKSIGEPDMPTAVRSTSIPTTISPGKAVSRRSRTQLVSIALFSALGLLISIIAVLYGVQGAWF
jgi:hypothetical protein